MSTQEYLGVLELFLSRASLFVLSIFIITHASRRVVREEKENSAELEESVQNLTWYHVIIFPFIGSAMLLILFYFFEYIQFILSLLTLVLSVVTLFVFFSPLLHQIFSARHRYLRIGVISIDWSITLAVVFAISLSILWLLTNHWFLLDLVGMASATFMILFVRIPSLKVATIFLLLLLVYDVFWVFLSSSIFNSNVMVEVAEKKAKNPVSVVAEKMNMPSFAQSQPSLALPGKLIVPSSFTEDSYSMLGLGDVVLPGMLLCLAMRFDTLCQSSSNSSPSQCCTTCQKMTYFLVSILGYATGLFLATLMVELFDYPQPALLYLVPCVLLPLIAKSHLQGHLDILWQGPFNNPPSYTNSKLPV